MDKGLKHYRGIMQSNSKPANTNKRAAKHQRRLAKPRQKQNLIIPMSELLEAIGGEKIKEEKPYTQEEVEDGINAIEEELINKKPTFADHEKECVGCKTYNFCRKGIELLHSRD